MDLSLLKLRFKLFNALCANALTVEINDIFYVVAKYARGLIFLQNYLIIVGEYLDSILLLDVENFSNLNRKNNSSQLVNFAYYACGFHDFPSLEHKFYHKSTA